MGWMGQWVPSVTVEADSRYNGQGLRSTLLTHTYTHSCCNETGAGLVQVASCTHQHTHISVWANTYLKSVVLMTHAHKQLKVVISNITALHVTHSLLIFMCNHTHSPVWYCLIHCVEDSPCCVPLKSLGKASVFIGGGELAKQTS